MKTLGEIKRLYFIDDKGNVILIPESSIHRDNGIRGKGFRLDELFNYSATQSERDGAGKFSELLVKSEYVHIPVSKDELLRLDCRKGPGHIFETIMSKTLEFRQASKDEDVIKFYKRVFQSKMKQDDAYRKEFVEYLASNYERINEMFISRGIMISDSVNIVIDWESNDLSNSINERKNQATFSIINMKMLERNNNVTSFNEIRNFLKVIKLYNSVLDSGEQIYGKADNILEFVVFKHFKELSEEGDADILDLAINKLKYSNASYTFGNVELIRNISDRDLLKIIKLVFANVNELISDNPVLVMEIYRRGAQEEFKFNSKDLINSLAKIREKLPSWPIVYGEEIDMMSKDIASLIDEREIERLAALVSDYSYELIFDVNEAYSIFIKDNFKYMDKSQPIFKKSKEYFDLLLKSKIESNLEKQSGNKAMNDMHVGQSLSRGFVLGEFNSLYNCMNLFVTVMKKENEYSEEVLREFFSDMFRKLVSSNKSERANFVRTFSYMLNSNEYDTVLGEASDLKIRVMLQEMSNSNLKDSSIEKLLSKPSQSEASWLYERRMNMRKLLGKSYIDVLQKLEGFQLRGSIKSTILRMELN